MLFIAVFICKLAYFLGSRIGRGSSLPGKIALKIYPAALTRLKLPGIIIAVTGSNGKSSVTQLIAHALASGGIPVQHNREGSNQTEGIATLLLRNSTYSGRVKCGALVMECDERYAPAVFSQIKPSALVVTNLCRDQLSRNGHREFIQDCLQDAILTAGAGTALVLNADDPYVAALGLRRDNAVWFGIGRDVINGQVRAGVYDDGAFCPQCKGRMEYDYRVESYYGGFRCVSCGFARPAPDFEVRSFDPGSGKVSLDIAAPGANAALAVYQGEAELRLAAPDLNSIYNFTAAIAAAAAAGVAPADTARALSDYRLTGGRVMSFTAGGRNVKLLICKHENSLAYNRALTQIKNNGKPCSVIILVNSISRKYYTSEISWLWDIDFDILSDCCVKEVILAGRYSSELMMRFAMTDIDIPKYRKLDDLPALRQCIGHSGSGDVYVLTCFADKALLLEKLGAGK